MIFDTIIGGCNQANVTGGVSLNLSGVTVNKAVYGGCNTSGKVPKTAITVNGDVSAANNGKTRIFGGGQGEATTVEDSKVLVQNGTVNANIYGGSGYGFVKSSTVLVSENPSDSKSKVVINGNVFGGGYGESSHTTNTNVTVDLSLVIGKDGSDDADVIVSETLHDTEQLGEVISGETSVELIWKNRDVSKIVGNVYGGGDMGQIGVGIIHASTNTSTIQTTGSTQVNFKNGYINGDVFGGGSGQPASGLNYTLYMGTVFGSCRVDVTGGYVSGSLYGAGYQSRLYAPSGTKATTVNIWETLKGCSYGNGYGLTTSPTGTKNTKTTPVVIGESVFGGGAKGDGNTTNPTVYTVVGDTMVNIIGVHDPDNSTVKHTPTEIYFDSHTKGGIYGDGNGVPKSIGYLGYDAEKEGWYLKHDVSNQDDDNRIFGAGSENSDQGKLRENDIYAIPEDTGIRSLEFRIVLHKGAAVLTEIRNVPVNLRFRVIKTEDGNYLTDKGSSDVVINIYTSITRIVPSQDVYMSSGRLYAGVANDSPANITANSAFTVQFITKFMPNAFNSTGNYMTEKLSTKCDEIYLLDKVNGIGITVKDDNGTITVTHVSQGSVNDYTIRSDDGGYSYSVDNGAYQPLEKMATDMNGV